MRYTVGDLTVENAKPFNLFNIARLRNKSSDKATSALKQSARCALEPFAKMIVENGSKPLLCELAVISDKNQWQNVIARDDSREFVSIIDTYECEGVLNSKLRRELIDCWKEAIRSLGASEKSKKKANYIVLNERVYNAVTYYEKFISQNGLPNGSVQGKTYCDNAPEAEIEHFSIDDKEKESSEESAKNAINLLIQETLVRASNELRNALKDATLAILPFSRLYDETGKEEDTSLLISLDKNIKKDLGGCLFAIYKNTPEEMNSPSPSSVHASNLKFFLSAQYLLTLSGLIEARRSLILYYEEQQKRNWGYLVHQFKNDIIYFSTNISKLRIFVEKNYDLPRELEERFELTKGQIESMLEIADLVVKATEGKLLLKENSINSLLEWFKEDMEELAELESKYLELCGDGGRLSIKFEEPDLDDAAINEMTALRGEDDRSVYHIREYRKIICHEVIKNAGCYTHPDDSKKTRSVKCGLFSHDEWVYFICQNYISDGNNKHGEITVLEGAKNLQEKDGKKSKFANCMGQFRLGMSALHDAPDIKVKVSKSNKRHVFTIAIPVGKFKS